MAEYPLPWQGHVSQGDDLLAAGDPTAARGLYGKALADLAAADQGSPTTTMWFAVTTWRIGVTDLVAGDRSHADATFTTADDLLRNVTWTAPSERTRLYAKEVLDQAGELRDRLAGESSWPKIVQAVRVCPHGCPSVTGNCGQQAQHC